MLQAGEVSADGFQVGEVDLGGDEALPVGSLGQNQPPRVDDRAPAVALPPLGVAAVLGRGDDVGLVLDGASAAEPTTHFGAGSASWR